MNKPTYHTPANWQCPHCHEEATIIPNLNDFDHEFGTEYPYDWGYAICSSCENYIEDAELMEEYYDD